MQKVIQISQEQTSMNEEEELMSLQEVFRVSLSPWQVRERERTIMNCTPEVGRIILVPLSSFVFDIELN